ncbi:hypothetical protein F2Q70_00032789 [Brassica cretica]|uniref:xyloglucan:xyloglucosyl transferase n=1 Tax=Brassica cretica TaxID=69181 RepID=A0A8S9FT81_BRACR|nr:hypothetical protein F2Q70_00032789 [Brassica cretica]
MAPGLCGLVTSVMSAIGAVMMMGVMGETSKIETDVKKTEEEPAHKIDLSCFSGNLKRNENENARNCWRTSDGNNFKVRSKNFCDDKRKIPAGKHLMDLVAVDWFKDSKRIDHVARRKGCAAQVAAEKGLFSMVVNVQVPGSTHYSMVFYFVTKELVPGSLLQRFVDGDDEFRNSRLKLIPLVPKVCSSLFLFVITTNKYIDIIFIFWVDDVPIREIKRKEEMKGDYPQKPMSLYATIWDASSWATSGGKFSVDYTFSPFVSEFKDIALDGCNVSESLTTLTRDNNNNINCSASDQLLMTSDYSTISPKQAAAMRRFRERYMYYSYCYDTVRYAVPPPECVILTAEKDRFRDTGRLKFGGSHTKILYNNGARKFALIGIGAIGCSPNELAQNSRDGTTCDERINSANRIFNSKLVSLVDHFNQNTPDAKFTYINAYGIFQDMVANPSRYGFRVTNAGCCGVGRNNGQITCLPGQAPCLNRDEFVFWDAFHPGEAANIVIGSRSFRRESPSDAHPYDIQQLALL